MIKIVTTNIGEAMTAFVMGAQTKKIAREWDEAFILANDSSHSARLALTHRIINMFIENKVPSNQIKRWFSEKNNFLGAIAPALAIRTSYGPKDKNVILLAAYIQLDLEER